LKTPLGGLIRIGGGAYGNTLAQGKVLNLTPESRGVESLRENLVLEFRGVAKLHELVGVAGVAILTSELAASVRIDGPAKRKPWIIAARQITAGGELAVFRVDLALQASAFGGHASDADEFGHLAIFAFCSPDVNGKYLLHAPSLMIGLRDARTTSVHQGSG